MAIERKVETKQAVTTAAAPKPSAKPAPKAGATSVDRLRSDLAEARRQHALEKLESPVTLRKLRKDLARALTAERATVGQKERA